ncbi:MAG TPA: HEAT repeat domain-containing protein [Planctomycetota bacterium]|nr:HEAT repeat domain-containing protein [Planctomycetota bacterium]
MVSKAPVLFAALCLVTVLPAHGGQYRGAGTPVSPPPGGPTTGPTAPSAPAPGTPTTGASPTIPDEVSWQVWWEFNKDEFLEQASVSDSAPVTGSDDFYLGTRRGEVRVDALKPNAIDLRDRIVPALAQLADRERNRDIQSACLVALGKVGRDGPGVELEQVLSARISRDDQEVRETAVLSLGIAGREKALPILAALLRGDAEGQRLSGKADVGDRTRAFAAYSLGLMAWRSSDGTVKQTAHDLLWAVLQDKTEKHRDLLSSAANGMGLLAGDPARGGHKRLAWITVEELLEWYQRDLGRGNEQIQAQAPVAIGRLLGRGSSSLHRRCKQHFAEVLLAERRSHPILRSAALALGMLALPVETDAEDADVARALQQHYEKGHDRLARYLSVIALARIGGSANRLWLLKAHERSNKTTERPWTGIALGLVAAESARGGAIDATVARLLLDDLQASQYPEVQGALAVAVGLSRYTAAVPTVMRLLRDNEQQETLAGYLCISLALLGDPVTTSTISAVLERSQRRPFLLQQAAVALGRLGDKDATTRLLDMLKRSESVAVLAAIANAIGQIGDRRAIDPLIELTHDSEITKLARAFVAAALGGVGDKDPLPWNMPLSRDCNYAAAVDTLTNGSTGVLDIL